MTTRESGIDLSGRDESVRAQDDFYRYWHGRWLSEFEIPEDKAEYAAFTKLHDESQEQLRDIITDLAQHDTDPTTVTGKIGAIYSDYLDTDTRDAAGLDPIATELADISVIPNIAALAGVFGDWDRRGLGAPLGTVVHQDNMDSTRYVLDLRQSGLGLPDRDYYLDDRFGEIREKYVDHISRMWQLAGFPGEPATIALEIMAAEARLAQISWDKVRNRDPQATYNLLSTEQASELAEGFALGDFLANAQAADKITDINIGQPSYLNELGTVLAEFGIEVWRNYLRWHLLAGTAALLTRELDQSNFEFYGTTLRGVPVQRPLWKRGVDLTQSVLPEALGQVYVERHFPPENKARMVELVDNLLIAYGEAIDELEWMSPETKIAAHEKLATFRPKIGYPDKWRNYDDLTIVPGDLVGNLRRAAAFAHDYEMAKLGGPVDRDEWFMPPQMVNAYYNPEMNEIVFPAAILQPPFFNMAADDAVNYGSIGAVIGHEISHGFDDKGCQYDGDGNLRNWWTEADQQAFEARTSTLVAQYAAYEPVAGHHINGELTLGENIADLSGLAVALRAYRNSLAGEPAPVIDGMTGEQRFFAGWAQVWRAQTREAELVRRLATDPHSPAEHRVLGVLVNSDDFVAAFDVQPGDGMWRDPADRVKIW